MSLQKIMFFCTLLLFVSYGYSREGKSFGQKRLIEFPDIPGYKTLKCDFHQHTVFSDGNVWPVIRTQEAVKDGLDAIAITDHLEYLPHKHDIPNEDRNIPYEIAKKESDNSDLIVINGAEITRAMPPGHVNGIFLTDVNKVVVKDSVQAIKEAAKQGAFIFWNHPNWVAQKPDGMAELTELHKRLIAEGYLKGIEVVNGDSYSDEALQIAIDNNLTMLGNSDIHGLIDWDYKVAEGGHRPVTLVFAKEKTADGIKEALNNGRTAVWFSNYLIGREEYLVPLLEKSLLFVKREQLESHMGKSLVTSVYIQNISDADLVLENLSGYTLHSQPDILTIKAHTTEIVYYKTLKYLPEFEAKFRVLSAVTAPKTHPEISLKIHE